MKKQMGNTKASLLILCSDLQSKHDKLKAENERLRTLLTLVNSKLDMCDRNTFGYERIWNETGKSVIERIQREIDEALKEADNG